MPEGLKITQEEGFIRFEFTAAFTVESGKQCIDAMVEAYTHYQNSKALLDCTAMSGEMKIFDRFAVTEYAGETIRFPLKTALVGREDQVLPDNFVENVAVNRGLNLKIFTDIKKAICWLNV